MTRLAPVTAVQKLYEMVCRREISVVRHLRTETKAAIGHRNPTGVFMSRSLGQSIPTRPSDRT